MRVLKGAIFDLDGVIVDTVPIHFKAWKKMFSEYGIEFTFEDYKKYVDGIPRIDGCRAIMKDYPEDVIQEAAERKQKYFREFIEKEEIPTFESTINFMKELKENGIKVSVLSSSKNSPFILKKIGVYNMLDAEVNGNDITKGKPDPEIIFKTLKKLNLNNNEVVVFEDAILGVKAAKNAGCFCIGIDRYNNPERLKEADYVISDVSQIDLKKLKEIFEK
ncbi:MAG: beta-phosphoglucomutase family hydrolase [Caldiserica bacterium]|nr:MAG: beta-phosphoglucomutase family hydrolase [Caldisericota bacterium]